MHIISVIICVYNGERYILEQLESIRLQTLQPDEVIFYDDCSTDYTVNIIKKYISDFNLSATWKLNINISNKGWRINFYDALSVCNGDYIFFGDQDDIWYSNKISIMIDIMNSNPNIYVLNGLFKTINSSGEDYNYLNFNSIKYDKKIIKSDLNRNLYINNYRHGCTMVIRKIIKEQLKYFKRCQLFKHDLWSLIIGSLFNGCYHVNLPVIKYRIHMNNVTIIEFSKDVKPNREKRIKNLENDFNYVAFLKSGIDSLDKNIINKKEYLNLLIAYNFYKFRLKLIKDSNLLYSIRLLSFLPIYIKYFKIKLYFVDIIEALKLKDILKRYKIFNKNS